MLNTEVQFFFLRDKKRFPVVCVAYQRSTGTQTSHGVFFAFATFNPRDQFNKQRAKSIANGRLQSTLSNVRYLAGIAEERPMELQNAIVRAIKASGTPQRAKEAATLWLADSRHDPSKFTRKPMQYTGDPWWWEAIDAEYGFDV